MLKWIGCLMVLSGCTGIGWYFSGLAKKRIRIMQELEGLLQRLYGEIEYAANDIPEVFRSMEKESVYFKGFWERMGTRMEEGRAARLWEIWREEISRKELYRRSIRFLGQEELFIMQEIGRSLGQTDRQSQLHTLALYQERLHKVLERVEQECHGQARVYRVAGVTAGFFLVILLL
ncbi:MAG: stage III sporulation protein AB [Lachnospiraceae bacterium]|nr:stage III sporulation protein AB [Lachnospiraceae bacterium]